jgi:hypothetical protein
VLQAPEFHRPPFDFLTFEQDGLHADSPLPVSAIICEHGQEIETHGLVGE